MVVDYKEEKVYDDNNGEVVYELDFIMNIGADGAFFDGKVTHDYEKVRHELIDPNIAIEKIWVESRKIHIVEIKKPLQRNVSEVNFIKVDNGEGYNFPHGHIISWEVSPIGIRVKAKIIDLYQNQGKTIRLLIKHGMVGVMPIVDRGVITGLGVIINSHTENTNW